MSANPDFHLPETHVPREMREALWCESLVCGWTPPSSLSPLALVLPSGDAHCRWFVIALLRLRINVFTKSRELSLVVLSDHFDINHLQLLLVGSEALTIIVRCLRCNEGRCHGQSHGRHCQSYRWRGFLFVLIFNHLFTDLLSKIQN